ncbi:MAG TPA: nodulation protein NfeD [bacterium]|nr:nodulation protein NfeD [bacterium]
MMRSLGFLFILTSFLIVPKSLLAADIFVARLEDATINPVTAEYISKALDRAEEENAECFILELDTPGGLLSSTHLMVKRILTAKIPVVVYIAPSGSRAGSAGVFITYASHVAAMAPSTRIGAAHPVSIEGKEKRSIWDALRDWVDALSKKKEEDQKGEESEAKQPAKEKTVGEQKILHDTVAFIESLARERNRNVEWAIQSVTESASITEEKALELHVIELIAKDRRDLLHRLDGWKVKIGEAEKAIQTEGALVVPVEMTLRQKFLNVLANPNIAYFFLMLGFYGLLFEVTHPGIGVPGVLGAIFIILALFSLQLLPTNYAGLALILLGIILFGAEIVIPGFGLPTLGGLVCMVLGSLMLFESPHEWMRVSSTLIISLSLATAAITLILVNAVVKTHRKKIKGGREGLIGETGQCESVIGPGKPGKIFVHGEIWNAVSKQFIAQGETVEIMGLDGMTLEVRKKD